MKKNINIQVTLTEGQLALIQNALEEFFRLRMGQTYIDLLDDLCFQNVEYHDKDGHIIDEVFNRLIQNRDDAREKLQEFYNICFERDIWRIQRTEEVDNAIDMWQEIRHWRWEQRDPEERGSGVDSYPPLHSGTEPRINLRCENNE